MEAMRLFVRTLEEEVSEWWSPELMEEEIFKSADMSDGKQEEEQEGLRKDTSGSESVVKRRSVAEVLVEGSWVSPYIDETRRPAPRYEHSAALVGNLLFLMGGNYAGRYLSDMWCFDLESLCWSRISGKQNAEEGERTAFPASAGHVAVPYNGDVLLIGGHERLERTKGKVKEFSPMNVYSFGAVSKEWSLVETSVEDGLSSGPLQRGGHSGSLIGSKVYIFGGETPNRSPLDELWVLDLESMTWSKPDVAGQAPVARSSHSAVTYQDRYVVIFGGGSIANCYNDLVVLDTQTMSWIWPEMTGPVPPVRAGHASALLGSVMYMIGGGNNTKGCADMYALDLKNFGSGPLEWVLVGNTPAEAAIASEGLSLLCVPMAGCLISFGGYNGKYHNAVHVYRPENYVLESLQDMGKKGLEEGGNRESSKSLASKDSEPLEEAEASKREAAARKEANSLEVSIMRKQLESANEAVQKAEKLAAAAREALSEEEQKNMHLQVEIAELKKEAAKVKELESELQRYREREEMNGKPKTSLWGYIAGSDAAAK